MSHQEQEYNSALERSQFWRSHLEAWPDTGLSQAEYCRRNHLKPNRFTYWKNKFKQDSCSMELVQLPESVFKTVSSPVYDKAPLRMTVGSSRFTLEIPDDFTPATLEQVLMILKEV